MRVISQSGMFDFPYEQIAVYRNDNNVFCRFSNVERYANLLGSYSTEEKAEKAMEMLHKNYIGMSVDFYKDKKGGILYHRRKETETNIFQFPKDEDVEV
jgi:hypothetical protein